MGLPTLKKEEIYGGSTIDEAAKIFNSILKGEGSDAQNNVVIANEGVALCTYDQKKSLPECVALARESLISGKAYEAVKKLIQ